MNYLDPDYRRDDSRYCFDLSEGLDSEPEEPSYYDCEEGA